MSNAFKGDFRFLALRLRWPCPAGGWNLRDWNRAGYDERERYVGRPFCLNPATTALSDGTRPLGIHFKAEEKLGVLRFLAHAGGRLAILALEDLDATKGGRMILHHEPDVTGTRLVDSLASNLGFSQIWLKERIAEADAKPFAGACFLRDRRPEAQTLFDTSQFRETGPVTRNHYPKGADLQRLLERPWERGGRHYRSFRV